MQDSIIYLLIAAMTIGGVTFLGSIALLLFGYFSIVQYREKQLNHRAGLKENKAAMRASPAEGRNGGDDSDNFIGQVMQYLPLLQQFQAMQQARGQVQAGTPTVNSENKSGAP